MSEFIRKVDGQLETTDNIDELNNLASTRQAKGVEDANIDNLIAQTHIISIELMHIIRTEDIIESRDDISKELNDYTKGVAKEFLQEVIDPFARDLVEFMKKHPEYIVKNMTIDSRLESGKSIAMRELKHALVEMMS